MSTTVSGPLGAISALLDEAAIPYMVVGSFASTVHGHPRTTQDLDLVIDPSDASLETFLASIDLGTYYVDLDTARDAFRRRTMFNIIDMNTAWKIDLVIRKDRPFSVEELKRRTSRTVAAIEVPMATAEDTIVAKLEWAKQSSSERQLIDVAGILQVRRSSLDLEYIARWVSDLELGTQWDAAKKLAE